MTHSSPKSNEELRPFDPLFAPVVASWVRTREELRWLAPRTPYPLTAAKVSNWTRRTGMALLYFHAGEPVPCGYGELNPMKGDPSHQWIGHVVVDIERRRAGLGKRLTEMLTRVAFDELGAKKISLVVFPENKVAIDCYLQAGYSVMAEEFQRFDKNSSPQRLIRLGRVAD